MFLYESKIKQIVQNKSLNLNQNSEVAEFAWIIQKLLLNFTDDFI